MRVRDHYQALGIPHDASAKEVEKAYQRWRDGWRRTEVGEEEYRLAESAYHALSDPRQRLSHDRRLGRITHPAWAEERRASARSCHREGMRNLARGRPVPALTWFRRAARIAPDAPASRSYLGLALARSGGCLHEAARHGEYAVERSPGEPAFLFNLATVYDLAGLRARALRLRLQAWQLIIRRSLGLHSSQIGL